MVAGPRRAAGIGHLHRRGWGQVLIAVGLALAGADWGLASEPLSEAQRRWLEDEVFAIIAGVEREAFLELPAAQRDDFIAAFWQARDPTPGTPRNELREEHERRLVHADKVYGPSSVVAGRKSDRGRIYTLLGPPASVRRFESQLKLVPCELWFYGKERRADLPAFFWLLFFRREGAGEYKLYSPIADGPRSLVVGDIQSWLNPMALGRILRQFDGELAEAAYSLIPGERRAGGEPSFSGELLLAQIDDLPTREIDLSYLSRIGRGGIAAELAFAGLPVALRADPLLDSSGWKLHYALEIPPGEVAFGAYQDKRYAALEVSGALLGPEGQVARALRETISLELAASDHAALARSPIGFHDRLLIEPGAYRLELMVRDRVGRRYRHVSAAAFVPDAQGIFLGAPLLLYRSEARPMAEPDSGYRWEQLALKPNLAGLYLREQTLGYAAQLRPPPGGAWELTERLRDAEGAVARSRPYPIDQLQILSGGVRMALGSIALGGLEPGGYRLELELSAAGGPLASAAAELEISPAAQLTRPKIITKSHIESRAEQLAERARLLALLGREERALPLLEQALAAAPQDGALVRIASWARLQRGDHRGALALAEPQLVRDPFDADLLICAAAASHELGRLRDAVRFYERARAQRGDEPDLLNALGQTYAEVGETRRARELLSRSLELEAEQPAVRELLRQLAPERPDPGSPPSTP